MYKLKRCLSQDICKKWERNECELLKKMRVTVVSCSERELTAEGKRLVKSGERK